MENSKAIVLDEACRLIGRYLHAFSYLEEAIDVGIGKLMGIDGSPLAVLSSTIPFAQKINTLLATERELAAMPDAARTKLIKALKSDVFALNDSRILAAHSRFEAVESGLIFKRVQAKDGVLKHHTIEWTTDSVKALCARAEEAASRIKEIIASMKPYEASLDFSDPRNSGYLATL